MTGNQGSARSRKIAKLLIEELEINENNVSIEVNDRSIAAYLDIKGVTFVEEICSPNFNLSGKFARNSIYALIYLQKCRDVLRIQTQSEGPAPDIATLTMNPICRALIEGICPDPQAYVNSVWQAVATAESNKMGGYAWLTAVPYPLPISGKNCREHNEAIRVPSRPDIPWTSGKLIATAFDIQTIAITPEIVLRFDYNNHELRISNRLPSSLRAGIVGQQLREVVSHPVLDQFDIRIKRLQDHSKGTSLMISGPCLHEQEPYTGHKWTYAEIEAMVPKTFEAILSG